MAKKITPDTVLKPGQIVRVFQSSVLGIVVRHEEFLGKSGFYAFNNAPGAKKFEKEYDVDWYTRKHVADLAKEQGEVITRGELLLMSRKNPSPNLRTLVRMTYRRNRSRARRVKTEA